MKRRLPWTVVELVAFLVEHASAEEALINTRGVFSEDVNRGRTQTKLTVALARAFDIKVSRRAVSMRPHSSFPDRLLLSPWYSPAEYVLLLLAFLILVLFCQGYP